MDESDKPGKLIWKRVAAVSMVVLACVALLLGARFARNSKLALDGMQLERPSFPRLAHAIGSGITQFWWLFAAMAVVASILIMRGKGDRRFRWIEWACAGLLVFAVLLAATGFQPIYEFIWR